MCTVLLPPGVNQIAVKYIISKLIDLKRITPIDLKLTCKPAGFSVK